MLVGARLYWMAAGKQRGPQSKGCRWLLMSGEEVCVAGAADDEIGRTRGCCLGELVGVRLSQGARRVKVADGC